MTTHKYHRFMDEVDPRAAELVKPCFFVGLTQELAAKQLEVSISTAERLWVFARAWLFRELKKAGNPPVQHFDFRMRGNGAGRRMNE